MNIVKVNHSYGAERCMEDCGRLADVKLDKANNELGERSRLRLCRTCAVAFALELAAKVEELSAECVGLDRPAPSYGPFSDMADATAYGIGQGSFMRQHQQRPTPRSPSPQSAAPAPEPARARDEKTRRFADLMRELKPSRPR